MLTEDIDYINGATMNQHREYMSDPFASGRKKKIGKKGLHFTDAAPDLRRDYIETLTNLNFRGYVAYSKVPNEASYVSVYFKLLREIIPHRLMACSGSVVKVGVEENSKISQKQLFGHFEGMLSELADSNNRRPEKLQVGSVAKKDFPCVSVPDFLLGIFSDYATDQGDRAALMFEQIRDKYRVILDADRRIIYSRKRQFTPWTFPTGVSC